MEEDYQIIETKIKTELTKVHQSMIRSAADHNTIARLYQISHRRSKDRFVKQQEASIVVEDEHMRVHFGEHDAKLGVYTVSG